MHKSFKKCCISNALDGTEDDMLWEDNVPTPSVNTHSEEEDDPSSSEDEFLNHYDEYDEILI